MTEKCYTEVRQFEFNFQVDPMQKMKNEEIFGTERVTRVIGICGQTLMARNCPFELTFNRVRTHDSALAPAVLWDCTGSAASFKFVWHELPLTWFRFLEATSISNFDWSDICFRKGRAIFSKPTCGILARWHFPIFAQVKALPVRQCYETGTSANRFINRAKLINCGSIWFTWKWDK